MHAHLQGDSTHEVQMAPQTDLGAIVREYLAALSDHDVGRCLQFFADDATVTLFTTFRGKAAIERFHRDRFGADLRIARVDRIETVGDTVTVHCAVATSKLAAAKIQALPGRAMIRLADGKIAAVRFGLAWPGNR
jgi:hypothetical protein